jgi:threonylcarbamoyladenosine tRNA methylthiotransferase MtaB
VRIRIESIGCRLNIGEMEALARQLASRGHRVVAAGELADLCVLNTCTVTSVASRKSRQILRQLKRRNPTASVVATGCYAELSPQRLHELGIDLVVGNDDKDRLAEILEERHLLSNVDPESDRDLETATSGRTRAFLKVQDGCDNRCTFCIVTVARGAGRSRTAATVEADVRELVATGYREVVLSGVHLGSWGQDLEPRHTITDLVRHLLTETSVERLRLSSLEPWDLEDEFFELLRDRRVLPHLHLPLQSGCDATLYRMARRTCQTDFARLVERAREACPDVSISTDVIVGFPGETDDEFADSLAFVEQTAFSKLHIFRFSARPGTRAASMPGKVPAAVATDRSRRMHELGSRLEADFQRRFVGRTVAVLWEESEPFGDGLRWSGLTDNYLRVVTETAADRDLVNSVTDTELVATLPGGLLGRIPGLSLDSMVEPNPGSPRLPVLRSA